MRQAVVDRYVDDFAYAFGVGRHALNVVGGLHPDQVIWFDIFVTGRSCERVGCWIVLN
jgi:hypothetical protein